jgi:hypothetical protein
MRKEGVAYLEWQIFSGFRIIGLMKSGLGCALIALLLMNLSLGIPGHSPVVKPAADHPGTGTSGEATKHIPADVQIDRETASPPRPDVSSPASVPPLPLSGSPGNSCHCGTPDDLHHASLDLLQLQHVLRI